MIEMGFVVCHEKVSEPAALGHAGLEMTVVRQGTHRTDTAAGWMSSTYGDMPNYRVNAAAPGASGGLEGEGQVVVDEADGDRALANG
jgi:hypothetical protein